MDSSRSFFSSYLSLSHWVMLGCLMLFIVLLSGCGLKKDVVPPSDPKYAKEMKAREQREQRAKEQHY